MFHFFWMCFCIIVLTSCTKAPFIDDGSVSDLVQERIDTSVEWHSYQNCAIQQFIKCELQNPLSAEKAIQIALLNNPHIQALYEEVGISYANLVEAGLLSNPMFELELRYPQESHLHTNIEYLITTSILDVFLIPLRTKYAAIELEQTKLKISHEILNVAFDVRETFYELILERERRALYKNLLELAGISKEIREQQYRIGNINVLEMQSMNAKFQEAELQFLNSNKTVVALEEKLNRLLGLYDTFCLKLPRTLEYEKHNLDLCHLEETALTKRLDLQVLQMELSKLQSQLSLKEWWTYTQLKAGIAGERDPDGTNLIGPGFSGEIPLFNNGQAARLRLFAEIRKAEDRVDELKIKILSEVREAYQLVTIYLNIMQDYEEKFLPMYKDILASSEQLYNVMGIGIDELLESKRNEFLAFQTYVEAKKHYLIATVQLKRALDGYLEE